MKDLKDRLEIALDHAGASKQALSRAVGVSPPAIGKWFTGATKVIEGQNLIKAAEFLGVNSDWLGAGIGEMVRGELRLPPLKTTELLEQLTSNLQRTAEGDRALIGSLLKHLAEQPQNPASGLAMLADLLAKGGLGSVSNNNMQAEAPAIPSKITFNMQHSTNKKQVINF